MVKSGYWGYLLVSTQKIKTVNSIKLNVNETETVMYCISNAAMRAALAATAGRFGFFCPNQKYFDHSLSPFSRMHSTERSVTDFFNPYRWAIHAIDRLSMFRSSQRYWPTAVCLFIAAWCIYRTLIGSRYLTQELCWIRIVRNFARAFVTTWAIYHKIFLILYYVEVNFL